MKFLALIITSLLFSTAYASEDFGAQASGEYSVTHCSNAQGTVKWEQGYGNGIKLTYYGFITGELELDLNQVNLVFSDKTSIKEEYSADCSYSKRSTFYSQKVVITPAANYPDVFQSYFPSNKIEATVFCEKTERKTRICPE